MDFKEEETEQVQSPEPSKDPPKVYRADKTIFDPRPRSSWSWWDDGCYIIFFVVMAVIAALFWIISQMF